MTSIAPSPSTRLVSLADIRAAAAALRGVAVRTPLLPADELAATVGLQAGALFVKPEMLQRGGAFKFVSRLTPEERARGVVAPSSGNHAQAVALAARLFGVPCTVVMPTTVTAAKRAGAQRLGARIELAGTTTADRMARAAELVVAEGLTLVPPYDNHIMSAGVATAIKALAPRASVIGVEPNGAPKLTRAREQGAPVRLAKTSGLADGLLAVEIGSIPFAHHQAYIDDVVLVGDGAMRDAVRYLLDRLKIVAEPSGAITIAALQAGLVVPNGVTVAILSGGNLEWPGLRELLADG